MTGWRDGSLLGWALTDWFWAKRFGVWLAAAAPGALKPLCWSVLAFELLNGRLPYLSSDPLGLALMHAQDPIPRLAPDRQDRQRAQQGPHPPRPRQQPDQS